MCVNGNINAMLNAIPTIVRAHVKLREWAHKRTATFEMKIVRLERGNWFIQTIR